MERQTEDFLEIKNRELKYLSSKMMFSLWSILTKDETKWFERFEKDELEYQSYMSSKETFNKIKFLKQISSLSVLNKRQLQVLQNDMLEFQTSRQRLKEISTIWNRLHALISRYRVSVKGKEYTEIETLYLLKTSSNIELREALWRSYMQLGSSVKSRLIQLVKLRNEIAKENGYDNFFEMRLRSQELSTSLVVDVIKELRRELDPIYRKIKNRIDGEVSQCYGIAAKDIQLWHYEHPFFQYVKEEELPQKSIHVENLKDKISSWFERRNINFRSIFSASDLTFRTEKSQANFCLNIDRGKDIRLSCNLGPDSQGLKILFHELGHAFYESELAEDLPFIVRQPHIFISEAIALLFEKLPFSLIEDHHNSQEYYSSIRYNPTMYTNQLVKLYWFIVVVEFERKLYENPLQDLNDAWWNLVEDVQLIRRPQDWVSIPSWAAKAHLTTLPVYYHNYLLGEILASQLEHFLTKSFGSWYHESSFQYLSETMIKPGKSLSWEKLLTHHNRSDFSISDYKDQIIRHLN